MKNLNKLQINPDKQLKNNELTLVRGGYGYLKCIRSWIFGGDCILGEVSNCDDNWMLTCGFYCFMSDAYICVG